MKQLHTMPVVPRDGFKATNVISLMEMVQFGQKAVKAMARFALSRSMDAQCSKVRRASNCFRAMVYKVLKTRGNREGFFRKNLYSAEKEAVHISYYKDETSDIVEFGACKRMV